MPDCLLLFLHYYSSSLYRGLLDWAPRDYMAEMLAPIAQMMMADARREVHPILSIRYGDSGRHQAFLPEPVWDERETEIHERTGLSQSLGWIEEGTGRDNEALAPSDIRVHGIQMVSLTAINTGRTVWWDDHPADRNPFNPENRHRFLELLGPSPDTDSESN